MLHPTPGVWVAGEEKNTFAEFAIAVVEIAWSHGYEIEEDAWAEDRPVFLAGEATPEMIEDLEVVTDFSIQFLQEQLPAGYEFTADKNGLVLHRLDSGEETQ